MVSASWTSLCDWRPLMSAMNPTPQESFSCAGSNKPKPCAPIVVLALLAHPRRACTARSRFGASLPAPPSFHLRMRKREGRGRQGRTHSRRQPSCRLAASGCLFRRRPTRPRPGGWPLHFLLPLFPHPLAVRRRAARIRPKIGTAMLSYAEHGKFRAQTQGHRPFFPSYLARERRADQSCGFGPFAARSSAMSGGGKWTTVGAQAQWATPLPIEERRDSEPAGGLARSARSDRNQECWLAGSEGNARGVCRVSVEGSQQLVNATGATTHQT